MPSFLKILAQQSKSPLNCRSCADLPISAPNLVLAKSSGYTKIKLKLPAIPPESSDMRKYLPLLVLGSTPLRKMTLSASLVEKLMA